MYKSYRFILLQSPVPSNQLLKQNTSPVPHFGALTVPDQIEGAIMPLIEENNVIKSTFNPVVMESTDNLSSSIIESSSDNEFIVNSNNNSSSTPQFIKSEAQTSVEMQNVSKNYVQSIFK